MNLSNVPEKGIMYALYIDKVKYEPYIKDQLPPKEELTQNLLELHLFDDQLEYRYIKKRDGEIETCVMDETIPHEDVYIERIFTFNGNDESAYGQIEVVNYICYDKNDLMKIPNYRLKEVKA